MIAQELERCLHDAFVAARAARHEFIGEERLLLELLDSPTAADVLRGCGVKLEELRRDLIGHVSAHTPVIPDDREVDTQPTLGFQRVIQRAILQVQSAGKKEVTGAHVLIAIFGEKDSPAARLLDKHGATRALAASRLSDSPGHDQAHGVAPTAPSTEAVVPDAAELQVVIYNDDYTPMEFVVGVLEKFFSMSREDATETMLEVHRQGVAVCGLYEREAALELMQQVLQLARQHGHPLICRVVAPK